MPSQVRRSLTRLLNKMEQNVNKSSGSLYPSSSDPLVPRAFSTNALEDYIEIEAINPQGNSLHFKMRLNSIFQKLMKAYCSRENLPPHSVAFLFNGTRIEPNDTPRSLGMKGKEVIDIILEKDWSEHFTISSPRSNKSLQSLPISSLSSNEKRKSYEQHRERSEPTIEQKFEIKVDPSQLQAINNNNHSSEINKKSHKSKGKKKEVIRSDDVIKMGNIAFITSCFGDNINNNDNNNNNNDINNNIFENQSKNALNDLKSKLEKVGMKLKEVGRIRVFLLNISNYDDFFNICKSFFGEKHMPIITAVEVSKLRHPHALIEIEADAVHIRRSKS